MTHVLVTISETDAKTGGVMLTKKLVPVPAKISSDVDLIEDMKMIGNLKTQLVVRRSAEDVHANGTDAERTEMQRRRVLWLSDQISQPGKWYVTDAITGKEVHAPETQTLHTALRIFLKNKANPTGKPTGKRARVES